jgi:hypothetical protein
MDARWKLLTFKKITPGDFEAPIPPCADHQQRLRGDVPGGDQRFRARQPRGLEEDGPFQDL